MALMESGFSVIVASGQGSGGISVTNFSGIEVYSLGERDSENLPRWLKRLVYIRMGKKTISWLDSLDKKPDAIILYSGYSPYLFRLIPWAKENSVKLVFDAVEWYDPDHFFGNLSPYQLNIELSMRKLIPRLGNVISISTFLHDYFSNKGCRSIKIPPLLDVVNAMYTVPEEALPMRLVYAGSPGKKDLLDTIIRATLLAKRSGVEVVLSIAGVSASDSTNFPSLRSFPSEFISGSIIFLGTLAHDEAMELVAKAHYSILLRNDARYSRAGFPTKFCESFSVGVPVISNITSDLNEYLISHKTGIICKGISPENLCAAIMSASKIEREPYLEMRRNCRVAALEAFDYRKFAGALGNFIRAAEV